jgi:hypothetical protein
MTTTSENASVDNDSTNAGTDRSTRGRVFRVIAVLALVLVVLAGAAAAYEIRDLRNRLDATQTQLQQVESTADDASQTADDATQKANDAADHADTIDKAVCEMDVQLSNVVILQRLKNC